MFYLYDHKLYKRSTILKIQKAENLLSLASKLITVAKAILSNRNSLILFIPHQNKHLCSDLEICVRN